MEKFNLLLWALFTALLCATVFFRILELIKSKPHAGRKSELFNTTDWFSVNLMGKNFFDIGVLFMMTISGVYGAGLYTFSAENPGFSIMLTYYGAGALAACGLFRILLIFGQILGDVFLFVSLLATFLFISPREMEISPWNEPFE